MFITLQGPADHSNKTLTRVKVHPNVMICNVVARANILDIVTERSSSGLRTIAPQRRGSP